MAALERIDFLKEITNKSGIWYLTFLIKFSFSNSLLIVKFIQFHRMGPNFGFTRWLIFPKQSYRLSWNLVGIKYTIVSWHCAICRKMYTEDLVYSVGEIWIQKPTIVDVDGIKYHSFLSLVVWTKESLCCCQCVNYINFLLQLTLVKSKQLVQTTSRRKKMSKERLRQSINESIEEESIVELMTSQFFVIALRYCSRKI